MKKSNKRFLVIKICEGKNLLPMDVLKNPDSYVTIEYNGKKISSKIIPSTRNPKWNETHKIKVTDQKEDKLEVTIYSKEENRSGDLKMMIPLSIPLNTLNIDGEMIKKEFELSYKCGNRKKAAGILIMEFQLIRSETESESSHSEKTSNASSTSHASSSESSSSDITSDKTESVGSDDSDETSSESGASESAKSKDSTSHNSETSESSDNASSDGNRAEEESSENKNSEASSDGSIISPIPKRSESSDGFSSDGSNRKNVNSPIPKRYESSDSTSSDGSNHEKAESVSDRSSEPSSSTKSDRSNHNDLDSSDSNNSDSKSSSYSHRESGGTPQRGSGHSRSPKRVIVKKRSRKKLTRRVQKQKSRHNFTKSSSASTSES